MRASSGTTADADLLASAVALRWSRPDLTAAIAEHVATTWTADDRTWVAAVGWLVHGRAAVGDGRVCASDTLAELAGRNPALLDDPAADRLRIEVATLAAAQCEPAVARLLVEPLSNDRPADVRADALGVLARCAFEDRPAAVGETTRRATVAWGTVGGVDAEIAVAALTLLSAAASRRAGHPDAAVDHAAEGLARLDDLHPGASAPHLATALAAEWITALVEAGRADAARAGCRETVAKHLGMTARPTRQTALLRLTVARALAASASAGAFEALERAATDASHCDTPDLEGLCLSTLGTLREQAGRLDAALESMRRAVAAQRRDRARSERFRAALRALPLRSPGSPTVAVPDRLVTAVPSQAVPGHRAADRAGVAHPSAVRWLSDPWTTGRWSYAAASDAERPGRAAIVATPGGGIALGLLDAHAGAVDDVAGTGVPSSIDEPVRPDGASEDDSGFYPPFEPLERMGQLGADGEATETQEPTVEMGERSTDDGESWLSIALAELDRALGTPLPDLGLARYRSGERAAPKIGANLAADAASSDEPSAAPGAVADLAALSRSHPEGRVADGLGDRLGLDGPDEQSVSPWASWTDEHDARRGVSRQPEDTGRQARHRDVEDLGGEQDGAPAKAAPAKAAPAKAASAAAAPRGAREALGTPGISAAPRPEAVGCVVTVDLVCASTPLTEGAAPLLRHVRERLASRVPARARLRLDDAEAVLSVVLPGQERSIAADWMHRTLPAVFHDAVDPACVVLLPPGTALRATLHDTNGPVGAQLLQRLERVRGSRGDARPVPVRWGVPISPGSGGRRRRPDGGGAVGADAGDGRAPARAAEVRSGCALAGMPAGDGAHSRPGEPHAEAATEVGGTHPSSGQAQAGAATGYGGAHHRPGGARAEGVYERPVGSDQVGMRERPGGAHPDGAHRRPGGTALEGAHEPPGGADREGVQERPSGPRREDLPERPSGPRREDLPERPGDAGSDGAPERPVRVHPEGAHERPGDVDSEGPHGRTGGPDSEGVHERAAGAGPEGAHGRSSDAPADALAGSDGRRAVGRGRHRRGKGARVPVGDVIAMSASSVGKGRPGSGVLVSDPEGVRGPTVTVDRPQSAAAGAPGPVDAAASRDGAARAQAELPVEGLGLADLLAGALAAYRAI